MYSFGGSTADGQEPQANLTAYKSNLYGTTYYGGASGGGAVFEVTTSGHESVLHSFGNDKDGRYPVAPVTLVRSTMYGTTGSGGAYTTGTVYQIMTSGNERVLYSFKESNGATPYAGLAVLRGMLYGTTYFGGDTHCNYGCGVVFSVSLSSGLETTLHEFAGRDGAGPSGRLAFFYGAFYGTTFSGGHDSGTVFKVSTSGDERVIYRFKRGFKRYPERGRRGWGPFTSGLIAMNCNFYGTTQHGGSGTGCGVSGCGAVFSVTRDGRERVLYSFQGETDGSTPSGDLIAVRGTLYGTTLNGGAYNNCYGGGCGTVYSVASSGAEHILHSFSGLPDGANPAAGLTLLNGKLYGTTSQGGTYGAGTVFALTPPVKSL